MKIARLSVLFVVVALVAAKMYAATPVEMTAEAVKQAADAAKQADEALTAAKAAVAKATAALEAATKSGEAEAIAKAKRNLEVLQELQQRLEKLAKNINAQLAIATEAQTSLAEATTDEAKMALVDKARKAAAQAAKLLRGVARDKAVVDQYLKDGTLPQQLFSRTRLPEPVSTTSTTMKGKEELPRQPQLRVNPTPVGRT